MVLPFVDRKGHVEIGLVFAPFRDEQVAWHAAHRI